MATQGTASKVSPFLKKQQNPQEILYSQSNGAVIHFASARSDWMICSDASHDS